MVNDEVSVYNLALNEVGARSNLSSTAEKDRGAEVCRLWYPVVRDQVLAGAPWASCKRSKRLAVLAQATDSVWSELEPDPGYSFAYDCPADMLTPRYFDSFAPFTLSTWSDENLPAIMSNAPQAILTYTWRNQLIERWETQLQLAVVYALAANICIPLSGKTTRAQQLLQQANNLLLTAQVTSANSDQAQYTSIPDWLQIRGYNDPGDMRYYHPFMPLRIGVASNVG